MFQLRFLLATPRKAAPHIFSHRDYRGQRTSPDDFHAAWNTYVCEPKGTPGQAGYKSSQDVMLELMQHSAINNAASHLFPIVELWHPTTRDRIKLAGDEIILRPSDLAAAQEAFDNTRVLIPNAPVPPPANDVNLAVTASSSADTGPLVNDVNEDTTLGRTIGTQINFGLQAQYTALQPDQTINLTILGDPTEGMLTELQSLQSDNPEAEITLIPRDPANEGKTYVFATIKKPKTSLEVIGNPGEEICQTPPKPSLSVLDRVRAEIQTNGKATATQLANTLGISAPAIKDAVALPDSGLQNKGGWISLTA
jgi:hypothetical protein